MKHYTLFLLAISTLWISTPAAANWWCVIIPSLCPPPVDVVTNDGPEGELWVPEIDNDSVVVIDTKTSQVTARYQLHPGARPAVLAASGEGHKVFVDNFGPFPYPSVSIIDRNTGEVRTESVASVPMGIFPSKDGTEVYLPEIGGLVEVMDVETEKVVRAFNFLPEIPVASINGPDDNLWVGFMSGKVGVYDPLTGEEIRPPLAVGGIATFWFTFTADGKTMFTDSVNTIGVVDIDSWTLKKNIQTSHDGVYRLGNPGAFTSELSPDGQSVYVSLFGENRVLIIDVASEEIVGHIDTDGSQIGLVFSEDGSRGYISDLGSSSAGYTGLLGEVLLFFNIITLGILEKGHVIEFDPVTNTEIRRIPTEEAPSIGIWLSNHN